MSPKKSKRSQAAQQLIDDLLEELPASKSPANADKAEADADANEVAMSDQTGSFGPIEQESDHHIVFDGENTQGILRPEGSSATKTKKSAAPFDGDAPLVTKMAQRSRIVRPPEDEIVREERQRPDADIDFGAMTAEDPYEGKLPVAGDDERTIRMAPNSTLVAPPEPRSEVIPIRPEKQTQATSTTPDRTSVIDRGGATEIRPGIKIPPSPRVDMPLGPGSAPTSFEGALKQNESLRIAQNRITELERELERVRRDNEALSTAGDTLRRRADELTSKAESLEIKAREAEIRLDEEKKVLRGQLQSKDRDNAEMKARVEEIETRLESNFKKIRVRERELEHRLEIVKMESATLVSTKDKMLLDLKRQIDQLHQESDSAKMKSQELFSQYKEKQETIRRVVRALRIALTILEGDDETVVPIKKAE